ncbi:GHMP family kinase ATP-binding protein [Anaeromyxobacter paludicola]|uniref:GHMP kinase n=1 Tax=Anaeromyxobacter paludicola TaxID=2918171 RepID=A0ABM7X5U7_9BACT|nr:GHMP kinase [Anaeromyxobacter paludicola]BDG07182.1 GHMP kinase [Anaeromyxobacter paludicola]
MIVRVKAPLRISFCGGGTDVSPYLEQHGGVVLSATINKYAYASLSERPEDGVAIQSLDYDVDARYGVDEVFRTDGELSLVRAVLKRFQLDRGVDIFLHSDAPPGSGLGSSSTMCVAMVALLKKYLGIHLGKYEMAELAYEIERRDLGIKGGKQDQYAAAFGGFNLIEFSAAQTVVNPLRLEDYVVRELEYHLVLCFTGRTRPSEGLIDYQVERYKRAEAGALEALHELKRLTLEMKDALVRGELDRFGRLLHDAFLAKQQMNPRAVPDEINQLYRVARESGALGGKILGAGGGGYLLLFCDFRKKHLVSRALEQAGGKVVDFEFVDHGVQSWFLKLDQGRPPDMTPRALRYARPR